MTHVTCRLTAKNRDQLRNSGNRVRATFTINRKPHAGSRAHWSEWPYGRRKWSQRAGAGRFVYTQGSVDRRRRIVIPADPFTAAGSSVNSSTSRRVFVRVPPPTAVINTDHKSPTSQHSPAPAAPSPSHRVTIRRPPSISPADDPLVIVYTRTDTEWINA